MKERVTRAEMVAPGVCLFRDHRDRRKKAWPRDASKRQHLNAKGQRQQHSRKRTPPRGPPIRGCWATRRKKGHGRGAKGFSLSSSLEVGERNRETVARERDKKNWNPQPGAEGSSPPPTNFRGEKKTLTTFAKPGRRRTHWLRGGAPGRVKIGRETSEGGDRSQAG